jgi:hypothetical protein
LTWSPMHDHPRKEAWVLCVSKRPPHRLDGLTSQARYVRGHFSLGKRKARCLAVRFLTLPVEHHACDFHRTRRSTFGRSPWTSMKRLFPFLQLHGTFSVDSLRVRWVPLCPSFQRLEAFAVSPHPGVRGFPTRGLLCPIRLFLRALAFRWGLPYLLSARLHIPQEVSRVPYRGLKQDEGGGALSTVPSALCGSPDGAWGRSRFPHALFHGAYGVTPCRAYCCRHDRFCWSGWHHRQGMPGS